MNSLFRRGKGWPILVTLVLTGCMASISGVPPTPDPATMNVSGVEKHRGLRKVMSANGSSPIRVITNNNYKVVSPGFISIIFDDVYKVRKNKPSQSFKSSNDFLSGRLNSVLRKHKIIAIAELASKISEEELDVDERRMESKHKTDIPHMRSIYTLQFPADAPTVEIASDLRLIKGVRTAYASPSSVANTYLTPINDQHPGNDRTNSPVHVLTAIGSPS